MAEKRILIFAPYGAWMVHHQLDAVIGTALAARGCEVIVLGCDGILENCIIAGNPRNAETCASCARMGTRVFTGLGLRLLQLGQLATPQDHAAAAAVVAEVSGKAGGSTLEDFRYEGHPLGMWSLASMQGYFRTGNLDLGDEKIAGPMRSQLANGVLLTRVLGRLLDEFRPDHIFSYNSIHYYYRIAFEAGRERKIPVLVHERGLLDGSFGLLDSESMNANEGRFRAWEPWKQVPLNDAQCREIRAYFRDREDGKNAFSRFYDFKEDAESLRHALRIPADGRIVAMFPSGDRELGAFEATQTKTFATQTDWIRASASICARHGLYLVIRHHPSNVQKGLVNHPFLAQMLDLARELPDCVRVIMPHEKLTAYSLAWNADLSLTYFSTMGAETLMRGVAGLCVGDSLYRPMGAELVRSPEDYEKAILAGLERTRGFGIAELGQAYRFAHFLICKLGYKFASFGIKDTHGTDIRVKTLAELAPGQDPILDRVCDHVMGGGSLYPLPQAEDADRGDAEERAFLEAELRELRTRRDVNRERGFTASSDGAALTALSIGPGDRMHAGLKTSLARSRERSVFALALEIGPGFSANLAGLRQALEQSQGRYVYLAAPGIEVDESVLSRSIDFLDRAESAELQAVRWGAWLGDGEGNLTGEIFTEEKPCPEYAEALQLWPALENPFYLFSTLVLRREFLSELTDWLDALSPFPPPEIAASLFDLFYGAKSGSIVSHNAIPMLRISPTPDAPAPGASNFPASLLRSAAASLALQSPLAAERSAPAGLAPAAVSVTASATATVPATATATVTAPATVTVTAPTMVAVTAPAPKAPPDAIVCYCFNRSRSQLQADHARLGNLSAVQRETRAGSKCGGCRLILESMFDERPDEILNLAGGGKSLCVRPGQHLMKGFVVADHRLDTAIFSSNAVPPQFSGQDMSMPVEYMLLDGAGKPVIHRTALLKTNETFGFDTRNENIPRPLYGMFLFKIGRANYGGARFNSVWTNGVSACSTHEINDSGRPSMVLPFLVDRQFLQGPNTVYLAMQNPHAWPIRASLQVFDEANAERSRQYREFAPLTTQWVDVFREIFAPALAADPDARLALRIESDPMRVELAPTVYFFLRNRNTDIWNGNHL